MAVPSFGAATTMPSEANDEPAAAGGGKNVVHNKQGIDMLHGRIWTKVLRFALPVAATGILEQLFNASGIMIVGNFSQSDGTAAVAAVGSNAPVTGLILNLSSASLSARTSSSPTTSDEAAAKRCATPCTRPSSPP